MIGQDRCLAVLSQALDSSQLGEMEAYLLINDLGLTRFASNIIHQSVSHSNAELHIRVAVGQRQGRATTNDLSATGVEKAASQARRNALLMPEDPDFHGLSSPAQPTTVPMRDQATQDYSPTARAEVVASVCEETMNNELTASGFFRTGTREAAVLSTKGAQAYHVGSLAGLLIMAMSDTSSGWSKGGSWQVAEIDAEGLTEEAIDKALRGRDPQTIDPGEYTVVLDPYAVDDLLNSLSLYGMGAMAVQDGRSWMNGVMGEQAVSPLVSIWDDGADPSGWPVPFDAEGVGRRRVDIIRNGVVLDPVHNSYTARKEGKDSTGHQSSPTSGPSPPTCL